MPPVVGIHDDNPCLIRNLDIAVVGIVLFKVRLKPLAILPVISWVDVVAVDVIADRRVTGGVALKSAFLRSLQDSFIP